MESMENTENTTAGKLGFDPDALREKYRLERDKRVRADGNEQYVEVAGEFTAYVEDPYIEAPEAREPLSDDVDVIIVGGGFGGLLTAAHLRQVLHRGMFVYQNRFLVPTQHSREAPEISSCRFYRP